MRREERQIDKYQSKLSAVCWCWPKMRRFYLLNLTDSQDSVERENLGKTWVNNLIVWPAVFLHKPGPIGFRAGLTKPSIQSARKRKKKRKEKDRQNKN